MTRLLVTGATGLTGSRVCAKAVERGWDVRGMVRSAEDGNVLAGLGAAPVLGDVRDEASVRAAAQGVDFIVNGAAVLGGTWSTSTLDEFHAINYAGAVTVMDVAADLGVRRTVMINTAAVLSWSHTVTESTPLLPPASLGPGYSTAKAAMFHDTMRRAHLGQELATVFPAGVYGPGVFVERALHPTSFDATILAGILGELEEYLAMPMMWVYVDDVAEVCLRALECGERGARYLAFGRPEDVVSLPQMCNRAAELARSWHRVGDADPSQEGSPFGSMASFLKRRMADPPFDSGRTTQELGWEFTPLADGLAQTVAWLRREGRIA